MDKLVKDPKPKERGGHRVAAHAFSQKLDEVGHSSQVEELSECTVVECGFLSEMSVLELMLLCRNTRCEFTIHVGSSGSLRVSIRPTQAA